MSEKKLILVGCDDMAALPAILKSVEGMGAFSPNVVSASRIADLLNIARAMNPDLVILCFRNNHLALKDFAVFVKKIDIPILCLTRRFDAGSPGWYQNYIVFTYPLEQVHNREYLSSQINSIFMLRPNKVVAQPALPENNRNLSRYVLELDQKVEVLHKVKERITQLYADVNDPIKAELTSIVNSIKSVAGDHKLWEDFKLYFEQTNPGFLQQLACKYPSLTAIDLKYCCYLLMNMTNDDIRHLLGISQDSVRTHKYRLKKKMALPLKQDLKTYLRSVS
jgi:DNA-binding CsgD family transcriptional regulator